ncbi:GNAT family N-acetyltransferase [Aeromonas hydrophila]|uniref:GNAT family N-acetyltransferase n=1 Tax=Aeromonas hydrophila TaxID=644 RepID=UPI00227D4796|nr:GNAT family N-acetyltransferase [Aeromonas hydrophila]WAF89394.1 GNAT family N-acetyltransferase [Aeromonas hydrophila]WAG02110.1 GNAT family N-acetyltransferase [Aeromonas hydrophila]
MELLIERALWQPHWAPVLQAWQRQGGRWLLLQSKVDEGLPSDIGGLWSCCPPDGVRSASALLAAWLDGDLPAQPARDPSRQILISGSASLLTLAREEGLLTLGPQGADLTLTAQDDLGAVLNRLRARRLTVPMLAEPASPSGPALQLRPLLACDEADVVRYCTDAALARYTLNIPHPYPPEAARDWLAGCWRKAALGLGWSWALTLPVGEDEAPLVGVISLHWNGELAWWVGVPWQNRGLATRAARLVKVFAFERLQLPVLTARHMPGNLASGRVMAKLGMRYCGRRELSGQPPCEVSYWQLERSQTLAAPLIQQLTPLLADERVVAAILQAGVEEGEPRRLALFLAQPEPESGLAVEPLPEQESDGPLAVEYHDQAVLAQAEPDQLYLYRGLLLKDFEEQGLAYLQQLASLQRQGPAPLTLAERRQRLGWLGTLARRASGENKQGDGVSRRYHQLWLLVELPALIDELAGRWHRGPDQTLSWLEQTDTELFAAYRAAMTTLQSSDLQTVLHLLAVRFPESTLPFLDKGAQGGGQFVE